MKLPNKKLLVASLLMALSVNTLASTDSEIDKITTDIKNTELSALSGVLKSTNTKEMIAKAESMGLTPVEAVQAAAWLLTLEDWVKYKAIMKLTPRGNWSKDIDPVTALGVEATTEEERKRYATISLQLEAKRIEKEVAFEKTRQQVAKGMFGDMPVVTPVNEREDAEFSSFVALFAHKNCNKSCEEYVKGVLRSTPKGAKLDIYVVGASSDEEVYALGSQVGVDQSLIESGKITVNYDAGKSMKLGLKKIPARIVVGADGKIKNEDYPYIGK
ncbi:TIGR03759 family integrating conjugative element protein [Motilimonas cestriensis]|uniref:TIGR03759 family integrating conjugative element protein n=1 Tax=Motilimonas cestriensis TaxID=2742685 RepID=UPI003DA4DEFA